MSKPQLIYDLLLDHCDSQAKLDELLIGLVWTLCRSNTDGSYGLAMTPLAQPRTLSWAGELKGRPIKDLAAWIRHWDPHQASVGLAAINSIINRQPLPDTVAIQSLASANNLAVFDYFAPQLINKKVVVIGHYPGIEQFSSKFPLTVLERQASSGDWPDTACEYVLPDADWVFITASALANKTFPRLAELSLTATTVLMGPSLPWLPHWHEFGIDYLAGIEILDAAALQETVAQAGGVKIFSSAVRYRIAALNPTLSLNWLKQQIATSFAAKQPLNSAMETWYSNGHNQRFPDYLALEAINTKLSRLDSAYKQLWDSHSAPLAG